VIGTYLAAALPVAVSLGEMGATRALVIVVAVTLYQQLENSVLSPRIVKSTVSLHPVAGLLAVIVGSRLAGVAGALFAIPLAATVAATLDAYVTRHNTAPEESEESEESATS
jgi:predicted PurR-regulated permease PerM